MNKVNFSDFKKVDIKNVSFSNQTNFTLAGAGVAVGKGIATAASRAASAVTKPLKKLVLGKELGGGFVKADEEAARRVGRVFHGMGTSAKQVGKELKDTSVGRSISSGINSLKNSTNPVARGVYKAGSIGKEMVGSAAGAGKDFIKGNLESAAKTKSLTGKIAKGTLGLGMAGLTLSIAPDAVNHFMDKTDKEMTEKLWGVNPDKYYAVEQDYNDPSRIRLVANKKGYDNRDNASLDISKDQGKGKNLGVLRGSALVRAYNRRFYDNREEQAQKA